MHVYRVPTFQVRTASNIRKCFLLNYSGIITLCWEEVLQPVFLTGQPPLATARFHNKSSSTLSSIPFHPSDNQLIFFITGFSENGLELIPA